MSRWNRKLLFLALCLVLSTMLFFVQGAMAKGECEDPKTLTYATMPWTDISTMAEVSDPFLKHISEVTGKKIGFYVPASYDSGVEALVHGWVDFARLTAFSYTIAHDKSKGNVVVFGFKQRRKGIFEQAGVGYHCILITKKGSGLKAIKDLKGKVLALVDPASTSGSLIPEVLFTEEELGGTSLKEYFGKVFYSGRHDRSALAVKEGRADAAFVATTAIDAYIRKKLIKAQDINEIWRSISIPMDAYVYRNKLCPELKEKIEKAYFMMHEYEAAKPIMDRLKIVRFVPVKDSYYDVIRKLAEAKAKKKK